MPVEGLPQCLAQTAAHSLSTAVVCVCVCGGSCQTCLRPGRWQGEACTRGCLGCGASRLGLFLWAEVVLQQGRLECKQEEQMNPRVLWGKFGHVLFFYIYWDSILKNEFTNKNTSKISELIYSPLPVLWMDGNLEVQ